MNKDKRVYREPVKQNHEQMALLLTFPREMSKKDVEALVNATNLPHDTTFQMQAFDPNIGSVTIYQP